MGEAQSGCSAEEGCCCLCALGGGGAATQKHLVVCCGLQEDGPSISSSKAWLVDRVLIRKGISIKRDGLTQDVGGATGGERSHCFQAQPVGFPESVWLAAVRNGIPN